MDEKTLIAARIKRIRKHLGLSQSAFGEKIGVQQRTVSDWESARTSPGAVEMLRIVGLGISPDWLLSGEGDLCSAKTHGYAASESSGPLAGRIDRALWRLIRTIVESSYRKNGISPSHGDVDDVVIGKYNMICRYIGDESRLDMAIDMLKYQIADEIEQGRTRAGKA